LHDTDYPLNQDQKGIRSLSKVIKKLGSKTFSQAAKKSGAAPGKGCWNDRPDSALRQAVRPYQVVELDGHLLDIRLSITCQDPFGYEQTMDISRIWILAVMDIFTRAVIGYHLALTAEYNRHDVIRAIQKSVEPHLPMNFTVPGLGYGSVGGFPSQLLPELSYAVWDELRFDNAKAHLAEDTLHALRDELGCVVHAGPAGAPNCRPFIERFFNTLCSTMSHRLPATTLSNPEELRRLLTASNRQPAIAMPLAELEQLIEAVLATVNATPHESLGGRSPIQALKYWVHDHPVPVRHLPEPMRNNLRLLKVNHTGRVRGNIAQGVRPYVSFFAARYSGPMLAERTDLIGKPVTLVYCPDDIRTLQVFETTGAEIGILTVTRGWNQAAHSLPMRQHILKLARDGKLQMDAETDPVQAYLRYLREEAPRRRKTATKLEAARRTTTAGESNLITPVSDRNHGKTTDDKSTEFGAEEGGTASAKPRRLSIPSGFSR
jgi:transposase InsO family protein